MVSRTRWIAVLALVGCDPAASPNTPRAEFSAVCDDTPMIRDAAACEALETLDPDATAEVDANLPADPTLLSVDAMVRMGDLSVVAGAYGSAAPSGAWFAAIDAAGATQWSDTLPGTEDIVAVLAVADAEGVWIAAVQVDDVTNVRRLGLDGTLVGDRVVSGFTATSLLAQPMGAVAMTGTSTGTAAYVGVDAAGNELWNGTDNEAMGPYVVAAGTVEFFAGPGPATWETDPRGTPEDGFPVDIGAQQAIITASGATLAAGSALGPLGDNLLLVRLDDAGESLWALNRPHAQPTVVLDGPMDASIVLGRSYACRPGTYLAVFDDVGGILGEVQVEAPPSPWVLDADGNLASVGLDAGTLTLRTYGVQS